MTYLLKLVEHERYNYSVSDRRTVVSDTTIAMTFSYSYACDATIIKSMYSSPSKRKRKVLMLIYLNGVYVDDCLEIMDAWVLDVLVLRLSFSLSINELVLDILEGC